jgi:hypothetical protein
MSSAGHVARVGKRRGAYWIFVGRPEGKSPFEELRGHFIFKKREGEKWT